MYNNPPVHGALIVSTILSSPDLKSLWLKEVKSFMLHQIRKLVGLAVAIMRDCAPESLIEIALQKIVMSTRCSDSCDEAEEIKKFVKETLKLGRLLSVGDVLGPLSKFDLFGHGKKLKVVMGLFDKLLEGIMREHEEKRCHDKRGGI
ncbi:hypothetical protein IFM89_008012 [Coptis chinensis]|uniref:Aspartate transaminase n=1 Tax=Coptis chinensis TaxID=261450 RepID=A0A835LQQ0_9MAGN|nr:hypothetical protein IFM89_008012 [Coptis chinensis]